MASGCSKGEIMVLFTTARCDTRYRDIWLTSRLWVEILNSMGLNGSVTVKSFNSAMSDSKYGFPYSVQNLASGEAKMVQQSNMQR